LHPARIKRLQAAISALDSCDLVMRWGLFN